MNVRSFFHNIPAFCSFCSSSNSASRDLERIAAREQKHFSYKTLSRATDKFNVDRKLGEGGFGPVYRGKLEDGREIAVKRLSQTSKQGKKEFLNEARLLLRVQHRNVVNLLGYCVRGENKLLVYEYVTHESLDKLLFKPGKREELDWKKRYDIILGIAKGLHYLHEDAHCCIIHRDIKASNILLDDKWAPKIADFGMARLFSKDETRENTGIAGTNGYMAPEYLMYGQLTVKADVFSFGVLILELVSGQKNSSVNMSPDADNLVARVKTVPEAIMKIIHGIEVGFFGVNQMIEHGATIVDNSGSKRESGLTLEEKKKEKKVESRTVNAKQNTGKEAEQEEMKERKKRAEKNRKLGVKRPKIQPILKQKPVSHCCRYLKGRCYEELKDVLGK